MKAAPNVRGIMKIAIELLILYRSDLLQLTKIIFRGFESTTVDNSVYSS